MSDSHDKKRTRVSRRSTAPVYSVDHESMDPDFDEDVEDLDEENQLKKQPKREVVKNNQRSSFKRAKRSVAWKHFTPFIGENNEERAMCNYCKRVFGAANGTTNMIKQSKTCEENPENNEGTQSKIAFEKSDKDEFSNMKSWMLDLDVVRKNLIRLIIGEELSFMFVEKPLFKDLMLSMCPTFKIPSRFTVARDCYKMFLEEQVKLKAYLQNNCQRACLTTDTWTSIQRVNYMSLTIHFVDNEWTLQRRLLNFCPISGHKGDDIARDVEDCLRPWDLCNKVFTMTVDNASANDSACKELKHMVKSNGDSIGDAKYLHMRYVAHIANIIVQAGLAPYVKCIEKVRLVVKYIRNSPARLIMFREHALNLKVDCKSALQYDVPTRWNSCYTMLEVALKYRCVFPRLGIPGDVDGHITTEEWNKIQVIVTFLKEFFDFTNRVSGSSYVTVSNVFYYIGHLVRLLNQWVCHEDEIYATMAKPMNEKCDKYWGSMEKMNMLMFVAIILDPKYRYEGLELALQNLYGHEEGERLARIVKDVTKELFNEYRVIYAPLYAEDQSKTRSTSNTPIVGSLEDQPSFFQDIDSLLTQRAISVGSSFTNEFDKYFHELREAEWNKGSLMWWKCNGHRFPILAHLARDILAIPITTVPSESAFSTGGRTIDKFQSSLSSKTAQASICTQDWIRADRRSQIPMLDEVINLLQESEKMEEDVEKNMSLDS